MRKTLKHLNLTGNEIFRNIRKNAFSVKLARGFEIVLKINSDKKMCLLLPLSASP